MKSSIKIALISAALLICTLTSSSEALSISILSPSPEEQVLESGRDFYVIGRIDRDGITPEELPFDIKVDVAETGLVRDGKIIPVRTVSSTEVSCGRSPNTVNRFFPILLPSLSAM